MTRLFTGDFSTGDFSQFDSMANKLINGDPAGYLGGYPIAVISQDHDCGYVCRIEVRDGDIPSFGGGERSEVGHSTAAAVAVNTTAWYAFSVKFDPVVPDDHTSSDYGFGIITQFHDEQIDSPSLSWGWPATPVSPVGYFSLVWEPQSAPGTYLGTKRLLDLPLDKGNWHDIKMEVHWSTSDANGYARVWHNGVRQTFITGSWGSGQTFTGRTVVPGGTNVRVGQGLYRAAEGTSPTEVIYHTGLRMADSEDSL